MISLIFVLLYPFLQKKEKMLRRAGIFSSAQVKGRPWRKRDTPIAIHASQRPPEDSNIDFSSLGLKYPITHSTEFVIERTSWSPAPSTPPKLPFMVERTVVGGSLPVYTEYKSGRTKVVTLLRKCRGDIGELKNDLELVVGKNVVVKPGKLEISGNHHRLLKKWLGGLGF